MSTQIAHLMPKAERDHRSAAEDFFFKAIMSKPSEKGLATIAASAVDDETSDLAVSPPSANAQLTELKLAESATSREVAATVVTAWDEVEREKKRGQHIESFLDTLPTKLREEASKMEFWDDEKLRKEFILSSVFDSELRQDVDNIWKVKLKSSVKDPSAPAPEFGLGEHAPLRRCFAGLLRRRDEIPKQFTLLLNGLQEVQNLCIPIEKEMEESIFILPLAYPLHHIADYINKVLLPARSGGDAEAAFHDIVTPQLQSLQKSYADLSTSETLKHSVDSLKGELNARATLQTDCLKLISDAVDAENALDETLSPSYEALRERKNDDIASIQKATLNITDSAMDVVSKIQLVTEKANAAFEGEEDVHNAAIAKLRYKLQSNGKRQEKVRRQIRESYRELEKEQQQHDSLVAEVTDRMVAWSRLSEAQKQFENACNARTQMLNEASERCLQLNKIVEDLDGVASEAIRHCKLHCSRAMSEESFRKLRVSKSAIENSLSWRRCVGDLMFLREKRLEAITSRMDDSWQLQFLLKGEVIKVKQDLEALEKDQKQVEHEWDRVAVYLARFKIPIPALTKLEKDSFVHTQRMHFLALAEKASVLQTPAKHKPSTSTHDSKIEAVHLPPLPPPREHSTGHKKSKKHHHHHHVQLQDDADGSQSPPPTSAKSDVRTPTPPPRLDAAATPPASSRMPRF